MATARQPTERPLWSSDSDEDNAEGKSSAMAAVGYTGPELRKRLNKIANAEPSDARGVAAALEAVGGGSRSSKSRKVATSDKAGVALLTAVDDEEFLQLRADVIAQLRTDLIVVSELESKAAASIESCRLDRADYVRSMTAFVTQQTQHAGRSIAIVKSSEDTMMRLKDSFTGMDDMIKGMQSMTSYNLVRKMHYFKANNEAILAWADILVRIKDVEHFADRITAGEFMEVYKDICVVQRIRKTLAVDSQSFRSQIGLMMPSFQSANEVIDDFLNAIRQRVKNAVTYSLDEAHRLEEGEDEEGEEGEEEHHDEEHHEGEEHPEGEGHAEGEAPPKPKKAKQDFKVLLEVLSVCAKEQGHDGDVLRFTGPTYPLDPYAPEDSPLSRSNVEQLVQDGAHDHVVYKMLGNDQENVMYLCTALDNAAEVYGHIESVLGTLRTVVPLAQLLIEEVHRSLVEEVEAHVENAEQGGAVDQNELLALRRSFQEYIDANVSFGGTVTQYTEVDGMDQLVSRLLAAASDVLKDYLIRISVNASKARIQGQAIDGETAGTKPLEPNHSEAGLNVMALIMDTVKTVGSGASLEVLHKLAVAVAAAVTAFVKDELKRLDYRAFFKAVDEAINKYNAIMNPKPIKGQQAPPAPPDPPPPTPLAKDDGPITWVVLCSGSINGVTQIKKQLTPLDRQFDALRHADEVELSEAGALPEGFEPGDDQVKWDSPFLKVLNDLPFVADELTARLVKFVVEISIKPEVVDMIASDDWGAGGAQVKGTFNEKPNKLILVEGMIHDAMKDIGESLPDEHRVKYKCQVLWYFSAMYIEQILKLLLPKAPRKWGHGKHVERDVKILTEKWGTFIEEEEHDEDFGKRVKNTKDGMAAFTRLVNCKTGDVFLSTIKDEFCTKFPDAPDFLFEMAIANRPEMDINSKTTAQQSWRSIWMARNSGKSNKQDAALKTTLFALLDENAIRGTSTGKKGGWLGGGSKEADEGPALSDRRVDGLPKPPDTPLLDLTDAPVANFGRGVKGPKKKQQAVAHQTVSLADLLAKK